MTARSNPIQRSFRQKAVNRTGRTQKGRSQFLFTQEIPGLAGSLVGCTRSVKLTIKYGQLLRGIYRYVSPCNRALLVLQAKYPVSWRHLRFRINASRTHLGEKKNSRTLKEKKIGVTEIGET